MLGGHPVIMIPDQSVSSKITDGRNRYLIPVSYREENGSWTPGFLQVVQLVGNASSSFEVTGFQEDAVTPGKVNPLENGDVFAINIYNGNSFLTGTNLVTVSNRSLSLIFGQQLRGGSFGYAVVNYGGRVSLTPTLKLYN